MQIDETRCPYKYNMSPSYNSLFTTTRINAGSLPSAVY